MLIYPIAKVNGAWSANLDVLSYAWSLMKEQGKARVVFSAGGVADEVDWVRHMTGKNRYGLLLFVNKDLAFVSWLTEFGAIGTAYAHFCGFKKGDNFTEEDILECGKAAIAYYEKLPGLKVLMGLTPRWNRAAIAFAEKLGMERLCVIPKVLPSAYRKNRSRDDGVLSTRSMEVENG